MEKTGYETNTPVCGYPKEGVRANGKLERRIVAGLLLQLRRAGMPCTSVYDGEEFVRVSTDQEALEVAFNVEVPHIHVGELDEIGRGTHAIMLVLGNGEDVLSDWSGGENAFSKLVDAFLDTINEYT